MDNMNCVDELEEKSVGPVLDMPDKHIRLRRQILMQEITKSMKPVLSIYRIDGSRKRRDRDYAYVVSVRKHPGKSFLQKIDEFRCCLQDNLIEGEELSFENRCFTIRHGSYSITYCLEGNSKKPDRIGYCESTEGTDTPCCVESLMRRMSAYTAFYWIRKNCTLHEKEAILVQMDLPELIKEYPNPAERFAACVRISKKGRKHRG